MASNGRLPDSQLRSIPGGRMRADAAASWLRMRDKIHREEGIWIAPTSPRTAYRKFADQAFFWNEFQAGRGNLAARPGTSNHGWGNAVDVPTREMRRAIDKWGAPYGWSKSWSDAPSEWWHLLYDPARDRHKNDAVKKPDERWLTPAEAKARTELLKQRKIAKRHGGWSEVAPMHLERARKAKSSLQRKRSAIKTAAERTGGGWDKKHRRARYRAMGRAL